MGPGPEGANLEQREYGFRRSLPGAGGDEEKSGGLGSGTKQPTWWWAGAWKL